MLSVFGISSQEGILMMILCAMHFVGLNMQTALQSDTI